LRNGHKSEIGPDGRRECPGSGWGWVVLHHARYGSKNRQKKHKRIRWGPKGEKVPERVSTIREIGNFGTQGRRERGPKAGRRILRGRAKKNPTKKKPKKTTPQNTNQKKTKTHNKKKKTNPKPQKRNKKPKKQPQTHQHKQKKPNQTKKKKKTTRQKNTKKKNHTNHPKKKKKKKKKKKNKKRPTKKKKKKKTKNTTPKQKTGRVEGKRKDALRASYEKVVHPSNPWEGELWERNL